MAKPQIPQPNKSQVHVIKWKKGAPLLTQEEAEAFLHREGYDSFCWYDVPGAQYPRHRHERDECLWILRGQIQFTIHDEIYTLESGDRIYLPAHTPHTAQVPSLTGVTYMVGSKVSNSRDSS